MAFLSAGAAASAGAGAGAAGTAATTGAAATGAGATAAGAAAKGLATEAIKEGAKGIAKDAAKNYISNEINNEPNAVNNQPKFTGTDISSSKFEKTDVTNVSHPYQAQEKSSLVGGILKGVGGAVDNLISSSENKKQDITNVKSFGNTSADMARQAATNPYDAGPYQKSKSSTSRFNETMKKLGQDLGAYAKEEGKNLVSQAIAGAAQSGPAVSYQPGFTGSPISSDEELKTEIKDAGGILPMFAEIDSYLYKYKPDAQEEYAGTGMMNNDNNLGVMAQELQENPLTEPAVKTDEKGNLALDSGRLTSINTAVIAELCKKVLELEEAVYGRK